MKHLLVFILALASVTKAQISQFPGGVGGSGSGQAYTATFTGVTSLGVLQSDHKQGTKVTGDCWDNATPAAKIAQTAGYPQVAANGDISFAWTGSKTGYCIVGTLGAIGKDGPQGPAGNAGAPGTPGNLWSDSGTVVYPPTDRNAAIGGSVCPEGATGALCATQVHLVGPGIGALAFTEGASAPDNPTTGRKVMYMLNDGTVNVKDSSGTVVQLLHSDGTAAARHGIAGTVYTVNEVAYTTFPYNCTIDFWDIMTDGTAAVVDLLVAAPGGTSLPTSAITGTGAGRPTLSTGNAVHGTNFTGWTTTTIVANSVVGIKLVSMTGATWVNFVAQCKN